MNRDEFEQAYASRHMGYDKRGVSDKKYSVERSRNGNDYIDDHIDRSWKNQQCIDLLEKAKIAKSVLIQAKALLRW